MKKLLSLLGSVSMIGTAGATVVACGNEKASESIPEVSTQELVDLINKAERIIGETKNKNPEAEAKLRISMADAQRVVDTPDVEQVEVDTAIVTLNAAIEDFQKATITDYTELEATINAANSAIEKNKNPNEEAEATLKEAIAKAQEVLNDKELAQTQVDEAVTVLKAAIKEFADATATDKTILLQTIESSEKRLRENHNPNADEELFRKAIEAAKIVAADEEASQEQVEIVNKELEEAFILFVQQQAIHTDYRALQEMIEKAESAIANNKNPNEKAELELQKIIDLAKSLVQQANSSQIEVDNYEKLLSKGIEKFEEDTKTVYTELAATITAAEEILTNNKNPNLDAEQIFKTAIELSKMIVNDTNATQEQVNKALNSLKTAIQNFQEATKTVYTKLETEIKIAKSALEKNENPNVEIDRFTSAIKQAEDVATNKEAIQEQVDTATTTLQKETRYFTHTPRTQYKELKAAIASAEQLLATNENLNANEEALRTAIEVAKRVADDWKAAQIKVDEATKALNEAVAKFEGTAKTNYTELKSTIAEAKEALANNLNPKAETQRLQSAINAAEAVLNTNVTQEAVDQAVVALQLEIRDFIGTPGEALENVVKIAKKLWLDDKLFESFSEDQLDSAKMAELVWTGMFDARYVGDDTEEAKAAREESLREFKEKDLASVISLEIKTANIGLEKAKAFAEQILNKGNSYVEKGLTLDKLVDALANLKDCLGNKDITSTQLLKATSETISAIKYLKSRMQIPDAEESFNLVIETNENIKLTLKDDLTAYFTSGGKIQKSLIERGSVTFPDLTFIVTI